ncbi:anaerobic benzoate catabolism transcriptional regulator [Streptomyces sp. ADI96-02]|uniref:helix-turn-helix domain-containing protein n=1 Tax=Streptomyces sp. ADI96-02 TaxID=1522760 RepID=UPI000F5529B9|nr:helix-turn-helix transcriptional regulator [Streptomyces sp. ADI96-02]RPK56184.1 anaerobic benzoate catabolism transcriptional regulator [Streptomyces sp. ADI96-02]
MSEDYEALGRAVREARIRQGMTQTQLAEVAGVSRATLQNLERGGRLRSLNLVKIESVLGWAPGSVQALLEGGAPSPIEEMPEAVGASSVTLSEEELAQAVTSAMVATVDTVTAAEIREVARRMVEDLKQRGIL